MTTDNIFPILAPFCGIIIAFSITSACCLRRQYKTLENRVYQLELHALQSKTSLEYPTQQNIPTMNTYPNYNYQPNVLQYNYPPQTYPVQVI